MKVSHIDEVVKVHMEAFKSHINVLLGVRYNSAFFNWFVNNNTIHFIGLNNDDIISGYIVGAQVGYQRSLTKKLLPIALVALLKRPHILLRQKIIKAIWGRTVGLIRNNNGNKIIQEFQNDRIISLVGIGVLESIRNKGLAQMLEAEFINEAKKSGFNIARLSVYKDNLRARNFYIKLGWKMIDSSQDIINYIKRIE